MTSSKGNAQWHNITYLSGERVNLDATSRCRTGAAAVDHTLRPEHAELAAHHHTLGTRQWHRLTTGITGVNAQGDAV